MLFEFNRFSSLLLIFFVHGLVYAILLFRKGSLNQGMADKWLALFLVLCSLYISPWMLGFAGWYDNQPYRDILFYTPFAQLFFIGPVIYFYVQCLLNPSFRFKKNDWLHLLPGILYLLFSLVMVVTDKMILGRYFFLADQSDPDFDAWYQLAGLLSMLCYLLISLRYYRMYLRLLYQVVSYADALLFRWIGNFLAAFLLMLLVRSGFFVLAFFIEVDYWSSWWYYFTFAIIFYYIAITGYSNSIQARVSFTPNLITYKPVLLLETPTPSGITAETNFDPASAKLTAEPDSEIDISRPGPDSSSPVAELEIWKERISVLLTEKQLYLDPELTLAMLARELNSSVSFVSKVVNQGFGMNFNDLINQRRIQAVIALLKAGEHKKQTLLGIAFEAGFNSKATFNRSFKKVTGVTPKEFIGQMDS